MRTLGNTGRVKFWTDECLASALVGRAHSHGYLPPETGFMVLKDIAHDDVGRVLRIEGQALAKSAARMTK